MAVWFDEPEVVRHEDWQGDEVRFTLRIPVKWWMARRYPRLALFGLMQRLLFRALWWRGASLP